MEWLFSALGAAVLVVVACGASLWWVWRKKIRRWYLLTLASSIHNFPGRIRLRRLEPFAWRKGERAAQRVTAFRELGFADLAGYAVEERPDARLFALADAKSGLIALVHEQEELGTWSDVLLFREGESQPALASSILRHPHFFLLPGDPKMHKPDAPPGELMDAVQTAAGRSARAVAVTAANFIPLFEQAFADAADRRLLDPLEDYEVRRLVLERNFGPDVKEQKDMLDDKEYASLKELLPEAIADQLRAVCEAQFLRETTLPAKEWQRSRERLIIIHDRTPLDRLTRRFVQGVFATKEMKLLLKKAGRAAGAPRETFARFNDALPAWQRYKKLGEVSRPVPADIYRAPLEGGAT